MSLRLAAPLLIALALAHVLIQGPPPLGQVLAYGLGHEAADYRMILFRDAALPRTVMALLVGAALGVAGSLLQHWLRNSLASPTTLGIASGAWCALVAATVFAPALAIDGGFWVACTGGLVAALLVLVIVGPRGMAGLPAILAGMAVNLLFGAVAQALVLVENQRVRDLGLWAAGDLQQNGWGEVLTLLPLAACLIAVALLLGRPLALFRLNVEVASGRGLSLALYGPVIAGMAIALTAAAISLVGPIAFVGLLAPNCARLLGARTSVGELFGALVVGAGGLLLTDAIAASVSTVTRDIVVTGVVSPFLGAPVLLLILLRRRLADRRPVAQAVPVTPGIAPHRIVAILAVLGLGLGVLAIFLGRSEAGWVWTSPDSMAVSFRWPRVLTAAMVGVALASGGVVLQTLLRNPLASPEIIGISTGAGFAVAMATVLTGSAIADPRPVSIMGSLAVMCLILFILRRGHHSTLGVIMMGIAAAAMLDAGLAFAISTGGDEVYTFLGWLAGTTIYADANSSLVLLGSVCALGAVLLALARWLDLIALGPEVAGGRGMHVALAQMALFGLAGVLVALATAAIGLAPFIGLMAPGFARLLGAGRARMHLIMAAMIGASLMIVSDWIGRMAFYPIQIPAGPGAAVIGGAYFILVLRRRLS
ncbi:MAG: Fe(3+)-hydroxamate ABC transporter permease FhuB [Pseudomonadota bacterium]